MRTKTVAEDFEDPQFLYSQGEYSEPPAVILPPAVRIGALLADIRREKLIIFSPRPPALVKN